MEQRLLQLFGGKAAAEARAQQLKIQKLQTAESTLDERISALDQEVNALEAKIGAAKRAVRAELATHRKITARSRRFAAQRKNLERELDMKTKILLEKERQRAHLGTLALAQDYTEHMREMRDIQQVALGDPDDLADITDTIEEYQEDQEEVMTTMKEHTDAMARVLGGGLDDTDDELQAELEALELDELNADLGELPPAPLRYVPARAPAAARAPASPPPTYDALLDAM